MTGHTGLSRCNISSAAVTRSVIVPLVLLATKVREHWYSVKGQRRKP